VYQEWEQQNAEVIKLGGLAILGAERHESRRIDNQLRGRSGRQGDPGSSRFYVALEDEIMRIFGGEQIAKLMEMLKIPESQPIEAAMVGKSIESAQTKVEGFFFDQRQRLVEFDDVMNKQREIIYKKRRKFLELSSMDLADTSANESVAASQTLRQEIIGYLDEALATNVTAAFSQSGEGATAAEIQAAHQQIVAYLVRLIPFDEASQKNLLERLTKLGDDQEKITRELQTLVHKTYEAREQTVGREINSEIEKQIMLGAIDQLWMDHLDAIEDLRQGIWMRGDKNTVLAEYRKEAFALFENLMTAIKQTVVERFFRVQVDPRVLAMQRLKEQESLLGRAKEQGTSAGTGKLTAELAAGGAEAGLATKNPPVAPEPPSDKSASSLAAALARQRQRAETVETSPATMSEADKYKGVGRNDPCPCGSGKKFKKCHGKVM
jgi:preprotein translocase subunit SecA